MADIEEADGNQGAVREWLGRAARAPRDKAWVADGVISDRWAPVSPSGTLDAFVWRTPDERIAAPVETARRRPPRRRRRGRRSGAAARARASAAGGRARAPGRAAPAPAPALAPAPRTGVIIDPATMAPDDPGPEEHEAKRRGFRLYANE